MARVNITITITSGTPVNIASGMNSAAMVTKGFSVIPPLPLNELCIQMKHGGTGLGYVMSGIRGVTSPTQQWRVPDFTAVTDVTAELAPATATAPGGSWSDPTNNQTTINGEQCWIDGSVSGDKVIVSYDTQK